MSDLVTILSGTALVCMLLGFLWSRYERKPTPRDWPDYPLDDPNQD